MDRKVYEKTRYENIYRHAKNKNYIIMVSKPKKTSVAKYNNAKIYDIEVARKVLAQLSLNIQQTHKKIHSELFKDVWVQYIDFCENVSKLAYNTLKKKKNMYNRYLKEFDKYKISELTRNEIANTISSFYCSDKQKNYSLIILRGFLNWCCDEDRNYISKNPTNGIKQIKTPKVEMKYWSIEEFNKFITYMRGLDTYSANMIRILVLLELYMGDRIGETRALTWDSIDVDNLTIRISHSINYDPLSKDYLKTTKNYHSDRVVDVSQKLIDELLEYKNYLIDTHITIKDLIFYNYKLNKPYSDTNLRKLFYQYCDKANVKRIRLYDLRHTYVTLMMSEGWELYHISKRIGHINYSTTVNKYGHIESKVRKEIAKTTDKYL